MGIKSKYLIFPIHRQYTELILKGVKKYELRSYFPSKTWQCERILIYETKADNGRGAIVGSFAFQVETVPASARAKMDYYEKHFYELGINRDEYIRWFVSKKANKEMYSFKINDLEVYETPIPLAKLGISSAPQSFRYVECGLEKIKERSNQ